MRRTSIRFRLMVLMILVATLPVVIVTWIAAGNTRRSVEAEMIDANRSRMVWADQYLTELIRQIDTLFVTLQINQQLMDSMANLDNPNVGVQFRSHNDIRNILTSAFHVYSRKIDELTLYIHENRKAFTVDFPGSRIYDLDIGVGNWARMQGKPVHMYFKHSGGDIYAYHSINRFEDRALIGGIAVRINRKVWEELAANMLSEENSSWFLVNDEGEILAGSPPAEVSSELRELIGRLNGERLPEPEIMRLKDELVFLNTAGSGKLSVVRAIPLETINRSSLSTVRAGILTGSLFAVSSAVLSILFSLRITRPIVNLARSMKSATLRSFEEKNVQTLDEIGLLERGYNSMMRRIKELIDVEYRNEIELKNAHLKALQAQINPHFLNNTLQLIGGMALAKGAPDIYRITRVVGDLLRYSIGSGNDVVTLADEIEHIRNYLFIQEQRFAGRCTVEWDVDDALLSARIPKFVLQPVVENAFEHGLQRKEGPWRVDVRVRQVGRRIAVLVRDNGVGMAEDTLRRIREALRGETGGPFAAGEAEDGGTVGGRARESGRGGGSAGGVKPGQSETNGTGGIAEGSGNAGEAAETGRHGSPAGGAGIVTASEGRDGGVIGRGGRDGGVRETGRREGAAESAGTGTAGGPGVAGLPRRSRGIGLANVNARLNLHFGGGHGIRIFSKPGGGTLIALAIPHAEKEEMPCTTS